MSEQTVALLLALTACGPDAFTSIPPLGDSAPDVLEEVADARADASDAGDARKDDAEVPDSGIDAKDAACPLSGQTECTSVVSNYCARYAACCQQFPGNGKCSVGFDVPATCKTFYTQNGFDCSSGKYTKSVCTAGASCSSSTSSASCSAMFVSSGPSESSFVACPAFWGQF